LIAARYNAIKMHHLPGALRSSGFFFAFTHAGRA
jgi:hypothetical protein